MNNIEKFNQICIKYLAIDFLKREDLQYKDFFSREINIEERELVLVLLELEKQVGIKFSDDFICNGGFKSFSSVCVYMKLYL